MRVGIDAMLKSFDPYVYYSESEIEDYKTRFRKYGRIGHIRTDSNYVIVTEPKKFTSCQIRLRLEIK